MRIIFLATQLILLSLNLSAELNPTVEDKAIRHLMEVNKHWENHESQIPTSIVRFQDDESRIQLHLLSLIEILKNTTQTQHTPEQLSRRHSLLEELTEYAKAKIFPVNRYHSIRQPYFIDVDDRFCAVGFMLKVSGNEHVAREIQSHQNYDFLADIVHESLPKWAFENGFQMDELAWIQPTYAPQNTFETIGTGTNGEVTKIETHQQKVYFIGNFTELNDEPCKGIGTYANGSAQCVLDGVEGTISDLFILSNGQLWLAGAFTHDGEQYQLARLENNEWQYVSIPQRPVSFGKRFFFSSMNTFCLILENNENHEMWCSQNFENWTHRLTLNGPVHTTHFQIPYTYLAGKFTHVTVHYGTDSIQEFNTNNLLSVKSLNSSSTWNPEVWTPYQLNLPSDIKVVRLAGQVIYVGGQSDASNPILLTRILYGDAQTLLFVPPTSQVSQSVNDFEITADGNMLIAGNISTDVLYGLDVMHYGRHLFNYAISTATLTPLALFDSPVVAVAKVGNDVFLGGGFQNNSGVPVRHIAKTISTSSIADTRAKKEFAVFPNPAKDKIWIKYATAIQGTLRIHDLAGRLIFEETINGRDRMEVDISQLSNQVVLVSIVQNGKNTQVERLSISD